MINVTYKVVEHDGGWAYKVGDVFSETFRTHDDAHRAAEIAAKRQRALGEDGEIVFEDASSKWHQQTSAGGDRPDTDVVDPAA